MVNNKAVSVSNSTGLSVWKSVVVVVVAAVVAVVPTGKSLLFYNHNSHIDMSIAPMVEEMKKLTSRLLE